MRIGIAYAVSPTSRKVDTWHDGFTAGIDHIAQRHDINWWNVLDSDLTHEAVAHRLATLDILLVKSSWQGTADRLTRPHIARRPSLPVGILVSGSGPPRSCDTSRFDVVFYQTSWYGQTLPKGPRYRWAFGIDTSIMKQPVKGKEVDRDIDWLFVGTPVDYKRPLQIIDRPGRRVVVGDIDGHDNSDIVNQLKGAHVEIHDFQDYHQLANFYRRAQNVLVPCTLHGGGERATLEALACGANVQVAEDNPKLLQLLREASETIPTHIDYGTSIERGLEQALHSPRPWFSKKVAHVQCGALEFKTSLRAKAGRIKRSALAAYRKMAR